MEASEFVLFIPHSTRNFPEKKKKKKATNIRYFISFSSFLLLVVIRRNKYLGKLSVNLLVWCSCIMRIRRNLPTSVERKLQCQSRSMNFNYVQRLLPLSLAPSGVRFDNCVHCRQKKDNNKHALELFYKIGCHLFVYFEIKNITSVQRYETKAKKKTRQK